VKRIAAWKLGDKPMKLRHFLAAAAILGAVSSAFPGAKAATSVLARSTIFVADMERSIAFYERLGFKAAAQPQPRPWSAQNAPLPLAAESSEMKIVILAGQNDQIGRIGLMQFGKPSLPKTFGPGDKMGTGTAVLVVGTDDIDAVFAALTAAGDAVLRGPKESSMVIQGMKRTSRTMFVRDPDGTVIEVVMTVKTEPAQ